MDLYPKDAELFVGIVARIGLNTREIVSCITDELLRYKYVVQEIHVTDLLNAFSPPLVIEKKPIEARYTSLIAACNKIRTDTRNDIMATLAITEIVSSREVPGRQANVQRRKAFVINQIKRPEEFELLRQVYGEHYVQISCHADGLVRIDRLRRKIVEDHPEDPKSSAWDLAARQLVHVDESEENVPSGQRVRKVFPLSDVIVDANTTKSASTGIERFFRALFGDLSVTPNTEEYGMELAHTAAQRSPDLSRQVGAAILTKTFEIQALGCNEVSKAGGGTYWENDPVDGRDFTFGRDKNYDRRRAVLLDLIHRLDKAEALKEELKETDAINKCLFSREDDLISDAQMMDSLEYGRSVHAEMNAIMDAARVGHVVRNCVLFSNTFPCHNCAKHIVAAGIDEVIYIYPYPKSYAEELFADSISVDPGKCDDGRVVFRQFIGIVGPMYARIFTKARWERDGGTVKPFEKSKASYIRTTPIPAYNQVEPILLDELRTLLEEKGYTPGFDSTEEDAAAHPLQDPPAD